MTSYLEIYAREIIPHIRAIDLLLRSGETISTDDATVLLGLTPAETSHLHGGSLTRDEFLTLMRQGGSTLCGLYRRELERGSPIAYTAEDIAYIYNIDSHAVHTAFDRLNATAVTGYMLTDVFAAIQV